MEELKDITVGLDQRISMYKSRLQELQKKRDRIDDEIATIKKYLELAETLYRLEAGRAKLPALSSQASSETDKDKPGRAVSLTDVTDQSREILLGRSKYVGMSVSEAAYQIRRGDRLPGAPHAGRAPDQGQGPRHVDRDVAQARPSVPQSSAQHVRGRGGEAASGLMQLAEGLAPRSDRSRT